MSAIHIIQQSFIQQLLIAATVEQTPAAAGGGLNTGGIVMMALSIGLVTAMLAFCMYRIIRGAEGAGKEGGRSSEGGRT